MSMYRPLPYPPPYIDDGWSRAVMPYDRDEWTGRPRRPWVDGRAVRDDWDSPFNPFDPRPPRAWRGALAPEDFGGANAAGAQPDRSTDLLVERLAHCSLGLKRAGELMTRAQTPEEKRDAAIDGYAAVSYLLGVLSGEGFSMPPGILEGAPAAASGGQTRAAHSGQACREAGEWVDRMIDKYGRGARGPWRDAGEGLDKIGGCIRETRENLGYGSR